MVPTFTPATDDSVMPGFERIARTTDEVAEDCLARDLTEAPRVQALVDDEGGDHREGWLRRLPGEPDLTGFIVEDGS